MLVTEDELDERGDHLGREEPTDEIEVESKFEIGNIKDMFVPNNQVSVSMEETKGIYAVCIDKERASFGRREISIDSAEEESVCHHALGRAFELNISMMKMNLGTWVVSPLNTSLKGW